MPYFIGIDSSTTASKALAVNERGEVVAASSHPHLLSAPRPLWSEQDPAEWWKATAASIREVLNVIPAREVAAIGLTGQMHGLTCLDQDNRVLRPAILWNDQRSGDQCAAITAKVGEKYLFERTGGMMLPGYTAPKLAWLRDHEPDIFYQIARILLPKDYVRFKLSGAYITDVSDASGMGLMDIGARAWSDRMLMAWDFPRAWLPELVESPEVCTTVSAEAAAETGLIAGTPIVGGAGDQPAGAVGSGIVVGGETSLTVGTSGVAFAASDRYKPEPGGRLSHFCHAVPGRWFYMGVMLSAAGGMRWLHDAIAPDVSYELLSDAAAPVPPGSNGLLFAPYLSGERHPHPDPLARGAFVGLTLRHERGHLVRAVMEGVAFGMGDNLEQLRALGLAPERAAVSGGAAQSKVWRQIIADVAGIPLYTVNTTEGAAFGAAILAAVGADAFPDVPTACGAMIREVEQIEPTPEGKAAYARLYPTFRRLYDVLKETNRGLAAFEENAD
jgi:xylulokinase